MSACDLCYAPNGGQVAWLDATLCGECEQMVRWKDIHSISTIKVLVCDHCGGSGFPDDEQGRCGCCYGVGKVYRAKSALEQLGDQADGPA